MGDLFGGQPADFPKRQRHLRIGGNNGMATGEDQPQHIVFDRFQVADLRFVDRVETVLDVLLRGIEPRPAADCIDCLEASCRNEPSERVAGNAVSRPGPRRRGKGVVQRFLCPVEIAEQTDQRRQNPARLRSVDFLDHAFQQAILTLAG